jgi:hypothetical protein
LFRDEPNILKTALKTRLKTYALVYATTPIAELLNWGVFGASEKFIEDVLGNLTF